MKKIERRAFVCRILAGILALGLALFVGRWFPQGGKWVSAPFTPPPNNTAGHLSGGTSRDGDGDVLP
ncbi:MAG: penicillin-binding protein, partial [Oscillospiraceae bacterium]|nr:penicillin-binding protein [Oscillospiraceae bacterium]